MPLKRCSWGSCTSDTRYKDRPHMQGVSFTRFPQPKTQPDRCLKWIRACNRPHDRLNVDKITAYHYVCSKHFTEGSIDPIAASDFDKLQKGTKSTNATDSLVQRSCVEPSSRSPREDVCNMKDGATQQQKSLSDILEDLRTLIFQLKHSVGVMPKRKNYVAALAATRRKRRQRAREANMQQVEQQNAGAAQIPGPRILQGCSMKDGATQQQKSLSGDSSIPSIVRSTLTMTENTQSYASEDVLGLSECKDQRGNSNKSCQPDNEKEYSEVVQAERELCKLSFRNPGKFMEDFDPAKSDRELRKLKRRIHKEKVKRNQMYDEFGLLLENSENRCDCLELDCPGCHFPCPKCSSPKCGPVCRNNRCWIYETVEIEGSDKTLSWPS